MKINNAVFYILCVALIALFPDAVLANNPMGTTLCMVVDWFNGRVGAALATLSIMILGVAALMGYITWKMCFFAELDVILIFGAGWFVETFGGNQCPPV